MWEWAYNSYFQTQETVDISQHLKALRKVDQRQLRSNVKSRI